MENAIEELSDSYICGNLSHVVSSLRRLKTEQRVHITLEVFCRLQEINPDIAMTFKRAIVRDCAAHLSS